MKSQWTQVFVIAAALSFLTTTLYVIFATAEIQWWNYYGTHIKSKQDWINSKQAEEKIDTII